VGFPLRGYPPWLLRLDVWSGAYARIADGRHGEVRCVMVLSPEEMERIEVAAAAEGISTLAYLQRMLAEQAAEIADAEVEQAHIAAEKQRVRAQTADAINKAADETDDPEVAEKLRAHARDWLDPNKRVL
jgi:hypothetical protein